VNISSESIHYKRYQINIPVYKGPLDLLLQLIEHAELDITTVALAQVTDQYLAHIHNLTNQNASDISSFLVIAARLVQIKSVALLPRQPVAGSENEEDFGEQLVQQLLLYRKFKKIAVFLENQQSKELKTFLRIPSVYNHFEPKYDLTGISLADLLEAASQIFSSKGKSISLDEVMTLPRITIREKIHTILDELRKKNSSSFRRLLKSWSRTEIVVTFLALLELVKRHFVEVHQEFPFDDIKMESIQSLQQEEDIQIEFDE
jgi:segregation and condensation protein A